MFKKYLLKLKKNSFPISEYYEGADFIDFMLLNLEAGSNIEHAFFQASSNLEPGLLKKQTQKVIALSNIGLSFGEAMEAVLKEEQLLFVFKELLENLTLSLKLGSPLAQILNHLSLHFRLLATSRLEEVAAEAPVKMIFPLVLFIFPVIFILLGSGAIQKLIQALNF
jgi:tight adherence protein C